MSDQDSTSSALRAIGLAVLLAWFAFGMVGFIGEYLWPGKGTLILAALVGIPVGTYVFLRMRRKK
jgi:hypothetical protein